MDFFLENEKMELESKKNKIQENIESGVLPDLSVESGKERIKQIDFIVSAIDDGVEGKEDRLKELEDDYYHVVSYLLG